MEEDKGPPPGGDSSKEPDKNATASSPVRASSSSRDGGEEAPSSSAPVNPPAAPRKRTRTESGNSESGIPAWIAGASPPRFVSLEELMSTAVGLDKMALAHEIAVNSDFKLQPTKPPEGSIAHRVHDTMHRAFWDSLREQLEGSPPTYEHAFELLAELKETLQSLLLPHHTRLRAEIEENIDLELLRQQADHDCLSIQKVADYILGVMGKLCAPIRDEKIAELRERQDLIDLFRGIFETLDLMKLDMANFTISQFRPVIQQNSAEYEREQFQKYLDTNPGGLRHTESWLRRGYALCRQEKEAAGATPTKQKTRAQATTNSQSAIASGDVLSLAYWELLEWCDSCAFPETLLVDQARLYDMRNRCLQLTVATSAVLVASNCAGRAVGDQPGFRTTLKERLLVILEDCEQRNLSERLVNVGEEVMGEIWRVLSGKNEAASASPPDESSQEQEGLSPPASLSPEPPPGWDEARKASLRSQIMDLAQAGNPVRKLIRDRIRTFVLSVIGSPSASPIKLPPGLSLVQSELARLAGGFLRLVTHNRQVFAERYEEILRGMVSQENTSSQSDTPGSSRGARSPETDNQG